MSSDAFGWARGTAGRATRLSSGWSAFGRVTCDWGLADGGGSRRPGAPAAAPSRVAGGTPVSCPPVLRPPWRSRPGSVGGGPNFSSTDRSTITLGLLYGLDCADAVDMANTNADRKSTRLNSSH